MVVIKLNYSKAAYVCIIIASFINLYFLFKTDVLWKQAIFAVCFLTAITVSIRGLRKKKF